MPNAHRNEDLDRDADWSLPAWLYNDPEFFAVEMKRVMRPSWQVVCHISDVPNIGDYHTFDFLGESILVVRGEDHVSNTAVQLQMFDALGTAPPAFAHEALLVGREGKLSKRLGSLGCDAFRADGIEPLALMALLARLGTSDPVEPVTSLAPLIDGIDFARFGRAPARFDLDELTKLNAKTIHALPFAAVCERLPCGMSEDAWLAIRTNLATIGGAGEWWHVIEGPIECGDNETDADFLAEAARLAADLDWAADPWHALTNALKDRTGRKGKALFLPLRRALTGRDHGPDMASLLPLIGRDRALQRLG